MLYLLTAEDCILTRGSLERRANFAKDDYCIVVNNEATLIYRDQ